MRRTAPAIVKSNFPNRFNNLKIFSRFIFASVAALFFSPLCAFSQNFSSTMAEVASKYDIPQSWNRSKVYLPHTTLAKPIEALSTSNPENVVVHLHGCGGIGRDEDTWAKHLTNNGYTVVLPDSLAIPGRRSNCDPGSNIRNAHNVPVGPLRVSEARYALEQVRKLASAKNIFLMGHSEGGATILMAPMSNFRGVISIGSFCSGPMVNINPEVPLLLINYQSDPWFKDVKYLCEEKTAHRSQKTQAIILSGLGHEAADNPDARKAVLDFLLAHSR